MKLMSTSEPQSPPGTHESLINTIKLFEKCLELVDADMCCLFLLKDFEDKTKPVVYFYSLLTAPPTCFHVTPLFKAYCSLLLTVAKKIGTNNAKKLVRTLF